MKIVFGALLTLVAQAATADDRPQMRELEVDGLVLSGAEYWPYVDDRDPVYPDEVLWGFYPQRGVPPPGDTEPNPDTATEAAVACATTAFAKLEAFFAREQPVLKRIVALGAEQGITNKFYLWTNDYSRAADPFPRPLRASRLWYWKRNPPVDGRTPGYWKWESTLTQDGRCLVPDDAQIEQYLSDKLRELEGT